MMPFAADSRSGDGKQTVIPGEERVGNLLARGRGIDADPDLAPPRPAFVGQG
jgi:hypothetical protein